MPPHRDAWDGTVVEACLKALMPGMSRSRWRPCDEASEPEVRTIRSIVDPAMRMAKANREGR